MSIKNRKILLLVFTFYCLSLFACKDKGNNSRNKNLFKTNSTTIVSEDSSQVHSEFSIGLNIESDSERGSWQNPDLVIEKFGDLHGKIVADIGSGTGYFTFPISRVAEKVLAIDIEQRYLDY